MNPLKQSFQGLNTQFTSSVTTQSIFQNNSLKKCTQINVRATQEITFQCCDMTLYFCLNMILTSLITNHIYHTNFTYNGFQQFLNIKFTLKRTHISGKASLRQQFQKQSVGINILNKIILIWIRKYGMLMFTKEGNHFKVPFICPQK